MSTDVAEFPYASEASRAAPRGAFAPLVALLGRIRRLWVPMLSVADQAITSGTSFVTAVIVGRSCSQADLGVYYLALTFTLALAGFHEAIISSPYAIFGARRRGRELAEFGGSVWAHHWGLTTASMLLVVAGIITLAFVNVGGIVPSVAWAILVAAPLLLVREAIRFFAYARLNVGKAITVDAVVACFQIGAMLLLWYFDALTVPRVFLAMGAACFLAAVGAFLFYPRTTHFVPKRFTGDWSENWSFAKWTAMSFLVGNMIPLLMPWLLTFAASTAATGVFGACNTLLGATNILVLGMGNFIKPKAASVFSSNGVIALRRLLIAASALFGVVFGTFSLAILLTGDWAMVFIFGPTFNGTGTILLILAVNVLVGSVGMIVSFGLLALGLSRTNFKSDICCCLVTIVTAVLLVFPYGGIGAAIALLVGTIACTVMRSASLYSSMRSEHSPHPISKTGKTRPLQCTNLPPRSAKLHIQSIQSILEPAK
jgi:O-antigen/teichoic acid export membrane protein